MPLDKMGHASAILGVLQLKESHPLQRDINAVSELLFLHQKEHIRENDLLIVSMWFYNSKILKDLV